MAYQYGAYGGQYPMSSQQYQNQQYQMPQQAQMPQLQQAPQMTQQQGGDYGFVCRPVSSKEEALSTQVAFFGAGTVMPDLAHGKIWMKRFNQNTGACDLLEFCQTEASEGTDEMKAIRKELEELRKKVAKMAGESYE